MVDKSICADSACASFAFLDGGGRSVAIVFGLLCVSLDDKQNFYRDADQHTLVVPEKEISSHHTKLPDGESAR